MFRTVTVYRGEKISARQGWLIVSNADGEQKLPIEDIYSIVIDNQQTALTTAACGGFLGFRASGRFGG